jgi:transcriptional repressor NrdR
VVDSREGKDGEVIRRRRECLQCHRRFTTYERIEEIHFMVVKKDGRREPLTGTVAGRPHQGRQACGHVANSRDRDDIRPTLRSRTGDLTGGGLVIRIHDLDEVASGSPCTGSSDVGQFVEEVKSLLGPAKRTGTSADPCRRTIR